MKLYEEIELLDNAISELLYGEEEPDQTALDNLMQARTDTITNGLESLCKIRARKQSEIDALRAESNRLSEKAERESKALLRLEQYIMSMLTRSGKKKITAGTFTVGTRTSSSVWVSPDFNNPEFMRTNSTTAPDKVAIKEALKAGRTIDGAYLVNKENLAVK
ncbi:MAG: siphovirus Gp157 family protein [Alphaproteobacteria bacterium]|nr:siphovirus Gp157 family protein [Alphaproteobacteria bacterium]